MDTQNKKTIIAYDKDNDILFFSKGKAYASIDIEDFILDFNKNGFLVGVEIDSASENLGISKNKLSQIELIRLNASYKPGFIKAIMLFKFKEEEMRVTIPLTVDTGHRKPVTETATFAR